MGAEVEADSLGDEWKGYILRISGGNDKQGFPMKQGVLTNGIVFKFKFSLSVIQEKYSMYMFNVQVEFVCFCQRVTHATDHAKTENENGSLSEDALLIVI